MPAPKPLSMFTTVTPAAQLLSIASSAAIPPKLAPYPTDVGTAIPAGDHPRHHRRQRALHAGHDHEHLGALQIVARRPSNR